MVTRCDAFMAQQQRCLGGIARGAESATLAQVPTFGGLDE